MKVADFGVARFKHKGGIMTAETGTYRWMAPEVSIINKPESLKLIFLPLTPSFSHLQVINHQSYDHRADVYSFAIVLWELATSKVFHISISYQSAVFIISILTPFFHADPLRELVSCTSRPRCEEGWLTLKIVD